MPRPSLCNGCRYARRSLDGNRTRCFAPAAMEQIAVKAMVSSGLHGWPGRFNSGMVAECSLRRVGPKYLTIRDAMVVFEIPEGRHVDQLVEAGRVLSETMREVAKVMQRQAAERDSR